MYYAKTRQPSKMMRNLSAAAMLALLPLAGVFDLLAENTSVREAGLAIGNVDRCVLAQYVMNRPSLFFYTLKDSILVNSPLMPGFAEQKVENDTALHLLWEGKERVILTVLLDPCGHFFEDELLRARHPHVARRVRRRLEHELDAQVLARGLHDRAAPAQRLVAHVAGEGDVHEGLGAHLLRAERDGVAAADVVGIDRHVRRRGNDANSLGSIFTN